MNHQTSIHRDALPAFRATQSMPTAVSRETLRRIRIIESTFGGNWRSKHPDVSISEMYRSAIDDTREIVFARVAPDTKDMLWNIADEWGVTLSDVVEELIREQCNDAEENRASS